MNRNLYEKQQFFLSEKLRGKTIMVSGATGLVGSAIIRYLTEMNDAYQADIRVLLLYRDEQKLKKVHASIIDKVNIFPRYFDTDEAVAFSDDVDYIIHAAGISGGSKMHLKDPLKIFDIGIGGTRSLLDYAANHGCKGFVYVSTYEIYGNVNDDNLISEKHACELDPMVLRNSYAEVKRVCESMLIAYSSKYGFNVYSGRLSSTFGTGVSLADPRFFAEFARCVVGGKNIILKSTGGTVRNYLDVDDAASAFLFILVNGENGQAYNLTNRNNAISVKDIAQRLIALAGNNVELVFDIADDISALGFRKEGVTLMDPSKLESIGWEPVHTLDETLTKLIDVFRI